MLMTILLTLFTTDNSLIWHFSTSLLQCTAYNVVLEGKAFSRVCLERGCPHVIEPVQNSSLRDTSPSPASPDQFKLLHFGIPLPHRAPPGPVQTSSLGDTQAGDWPSTERNSCICCVGGYCIPSTMYQWTTHQATKEIGTITWMMILCCPCQ